MILFLHSTSTPASSCKPHPPPTNSSQVLNRKYLYFRITVFYVIRKSFYLVWGRFKVSIGLEGVLSCPMIDFEEPLWDIASVKWCHGICSPSSNLDICTSNMIAASSSRASAGVTGWPCPRSTPRCGSAGRSRAWTPSSVTASPASTTSARRPSSRPSRTATSGFCR